MENLRKLRIDLGWSQPKLASEAGITKQAVANAEKGNEVFPTTAKAIADALSRGYGREIKVSDIEGLKVV
jgi:transcriptional regulator with XRE-family HTH domain